MMTKKTLAVLMIMLLTSCSSIIKGTSQSITFTSEPSGARVIIDGQERGVTPLTLKLKKNKYDTIMIRKNGYKAATRPLEKSYDAISILNVFWDLSTTDFLTGAIYEYEPNSYHVTLETDSTK